MAKIGASLEELGLTWNRISSIPAEHTDGLVSLRKLYIRHNELQNFHMPGESQTRIQEAHNSAQRPSLYCSYNSFLLQNMLKFSEYSWDF